MKKYLRCIWLIMYINVICIDDLNMRKWKYVGMPTKIAWFSFACEVLFDVNFCQHKTVFYEQGRALGKKIRN